jgi:hypothetical protein
MLGPQRRGEKDGFTMRHFLQRCSESAATRRRSAVRAEALFQPHLPLERWFLPLVFAVRPRKGSPLVASQAPMGLSSFLRASSAIIRYTKKLRSLLYRNYEGARRKWQNERRVEDQGCKEISTEAVSRAGESRVWVVPKRISIGRARFIGFYAGADYSDDCRAVGHTRVLVPRRKSDQSIDTGARRSSDIKAGARGWTANARARSYHCSALRTASKQEARLDAEL